MSNTNNSLQTQTSNALHNAIMEARGKDRPPMLAPGNYVLRKSRIKRYIDTKPNNELIHYCLQNPPYKFKWTKKAVPVVEGSSKTTIEGCMKNYKNVSQDIRDQLNAKAEAVQIILIGIDNDIYSTILLQLQPEWQRFVTLVKQSQELKTVSYHKLYDILKQHQTEVNEIRAKRLARTANLLALVAQQQTVYHPQNHPTHYTKISSTRSQPATTRNRGKAIVNSPPPTYDQEPATVVADDQMSKEKEIDKLMALISLSFKKIYKPANNNLKTSSNTSRANQDNSLRINRGTGYDNQMVVNVDGARENVGAQKSKQAKDAAYHKEKMLLCKQEEAGVKLNAKQADWKDDTDDEPDDQELEAHYMYTAHIQEVTPDAADNFGPIFDAEPLQKIQNDDDNYNVFDNDQEHLEQPEFVNEPYPVEKDEHNIIIDSLDMSYDREQDNQDDTDDLFLNEIDRLSREYYYADHMNFILGVYTTLDEFTDLQCDYVDQVVKCERLEKELSKRVISTTSVSRPQLKSNQIEDRVMPNNSQGKKQEVEDHDRNFKFSNNKTYVTVCNDSLNAKTSSVNFVCVTYRKCMLNDNHDMCVLYYINGVNSRTRQPIVVPISTRKPKRNVNQSVATSHKKTVATESTVKKPRSIIRKLYEQVSKTCSWWYPKFTPCGYKWKPKSPIGNVNANVSMPLGNALATTNILKPMTPRCSTLSNTPLSSNSFAARTVKFGNDQIASIIGYGDLVQGTITIKRVYYVEGLNHNLFFVGQFCNADLEVAFRKSICYIHDLKGNDLLTGSNGIDLYSITLQETSTPNLICLMAKATSSQAWLWHRRLSHLKLKMVDM
ncbi:hypothetical protein Tco_1336715 [Tanacetum coccineum]